jgi:hypothetical protein
MGKRETANGKRPPKCGTPIAPASEQTCPTSVQTWQTSELTAHAGVQVWPASVQSAPASTGSWLQAYKVLLQA